MIEQEKTKWKGGLLGDEMGMGKTIQAVSLIMSDYPSKAPTLVVVPPVAMLQWQNEIRDYTNGLLKVLLYHGAAVKKLTPKQLKAYDILITSCKTHLRRPGRECLGSGLGREADFARRQHARMHASQAAARLDPQGQG